MVRFSTRVPVLIMVPNVLLYEYCFWTLNDNDK